MTLDGTRSEAAMTIANRAAMEAYYAGLSDEALREAMREGPTAFSSQDAWAIVVAEWQRRGAPTPEASLRANADLGTRCHACGATTELYATPFGLARVIDIEAPSSPDYAAIGLSVLSVAVGAGAAWPFVLRRLVGGREGRARLEVLRLELLLCAACEEQRGAKLTAEDYACHPQWEAAEHWGFTTILDADALEAMPSSNTQ